MYGEGGIRTLEELAPLAVFETAIGFLKLSLSKECSDWSSDPAMGLPDLSYNHARNEADLQRQQRSNAAVYFGVDLMGLEKEYRTLEVMS